MFKVNNRNTRTKMWNMFKVNNKDTKTTPWRRFGVFIVNFEHISYLCSSVSIVNLEQKITLHYVSSSKDSWTWYSLVSAILCCIIYRMISSTVSYLLYRLFLNKSVFSTFNNFLLLTVVIILTISRVGLKIVAWIDKWTIAESMHEQILQHMMISITGWILQQFSWMLQRINKCWNKWVFLWYLLFYELFILSITCS